MMKPERVCAIFFACPVVAGAGGFVPGNILPPPVGIFQIHQAQGFLLSGGVYGFGVAALWVTAAFVAQKLHRS